MRRLDIIYCSEVMFSFEIIWRRANKSGQICLIMVVDEGRLGEQAIAEAAHLLVIDDVEIKFTNKIRHLQSRSRAAFGVFC